MTPRRAIEALWKLATALAVLDDPSLVVSPTLREEARHEP
jgi:hypothetical protein